MIWSNSKELILESMNPSFLFILMRLLLILLVQNLLFYLIQCIVNNNLMHKSYQPTTQMFTNEIIKIKIRENHKT